MIILRATSSQIKSEAMKQGMRTLRQDGWERIKQGMTTPSEIIRVTQEESV